MKFFSIPVKLIFVTVLLLSSPKASWASNDPTGEAAAKNVVVSYFKALNKGDLGKIKKLYHRDSVFLPEGGPAARGIEEIGDAYRAVFRKIKLNTRHDYKHVSVHGDIAIVESKASGDITILETKKVIPSTSKELFVLRLINKAWRIDRYIFNRSE